MCIRCIFLASLLTAGASIGGLVGTAWAQADFVLHNARIYTVDEKHPRAEAMAVGGDRILMVGVEAEVIQSYPEAVRIDAGGRAVIPGLIDAHAHLMGQGLAMLQVDLVGSGSKADVVSRLQAAEENLPEGAWLRGRGWDENDWPVKVFPTRADLDRAFPERPVWLERVDGHAAWANTAALRAAGIDAIRSAPDPEGGSILRDDSGEPAGIFVDTAMRLVERKLPKPEPEEYREALRLVLHETSRHGLTSVHDAGIDRQDIERYQAAIDAGTFDLRLYGMVEGTGPAFERMCEDGPILDYRDRLTVRSVKFYADGALGSRGAALLAPYSDDPGNDGLLRINPESFTSRIVAAMRCGLQVNTHAIGDRANRVVLDAYEASMEQVGGMVGRHRIEHAQIVHPHDIPRFRELSVIASMQPAHATSDMYWADDRLGPGRLDGAYAWRSFLDAGVRVAFGSDFPVEDVDPLQGFYAAVTRRDAAGRPPDGWLPRQRVTRVEALRAFTLDAAYASFQDDDLGSLEAGKKADFVVLSKDIMTCAEEEILDARVLATYLGGFRIYQAGDESNQPR